MLSLAFEVHCQFKHKSASISFSINSVSGFARKIIVLFRAFNCLLRRKRVRYKEASDNRVFHANPHSRVVRAFVVALEVGVKIDENVVCYSKRTRLSHHCGFRVRSRGRSNVTRGITERLWRSRSISAWPASRLGIGVASIFI